MIKAADLPKSLPIFVLPGALLLPRARLPLNIFEPKYLAMIEDCLKTPTRLIGMIQPRESEQSTTDPSLHQVGCAGRLTTFSETDDGRYLITLTGISRFRILELEDGFKPYICANAEWSSFSGDSASKREIDKDFDRERFLSLLKEYFDHAELTSDWDSMKDAEEELLINSLSMMCPFRPEEKQALLEAPTLKERREVLMTLMRFALAGEENGALQ